MNVSKELARSAQEKEFTNPRVFHDLFKDMFHTVTSRLLTPLTHENADAALEYCKVRMNPYNLTRLCDVNELLKRF